MGCYNGDKKLVKTRENCFRCGKQDLTVPVVYGENTLAMKKAHDSKNLYYLGVERVNTHPQIYCKRCDVLS